MALLCSIGMRKTGKCLCRGGKGGGGIRGCWIVCVCVGRRGGPRGLLLEVMRLFPYLLGDR